MENQLTIIDPKEFGLEEKQANKMTSGLDVIIKERQALEVIYNEVIKKELNKATFKEAKELRSKIRDNRTKGIEVWHKTNKAFYLAGGRFVDAYKNKEVIINEQMESRLDEIEKYELNLEIERKAKVKAERTELLERYGTDVQFIALDEMNQEQFDLLLERERCAHEARVEAERLAEIKRIADEKAEADRIEKERLAEVKRIEDQRIENERLKKEADKREAELAIERKKQAEMQAKKDAEAKAENERLAEIAKAEKEKADKLAKEIQDAKDAKLKAEQDAKIEADKLAKAPVKRQMTIWIDAFEMPQIAIQNDTSIEIIKKFAAFKKWAKSEIEKL